jgi:hypothetical protein
MSTTRRGMDRRTDKEKRAATVKTRRIVQKNMSKLVDDLHDNDFRSLLIESEQISSDGSFFMRVYIDEAEIAGLRVLKLLEIAAEHNATVSLSEVWLSGQSRVSRMALWPDQR